MHLHSTLTILSTLGFAATSVAYDSISFTTWNCTDCTPVPGIFCSTGTRGNLPPNECYPMWNGSFTMKTFGATLPSCQVNLYTSYDCSGAAEVHKENGGRCESKGPTNSYKLTC